MAVLFHVSQSAAVYRVLLPDLRGDTRWELEQHSLVSLWMLVALLEVTGQLRQVENPATVASGTPS